MSWIVAAVLVVPMVVVVGLAVNGAPFLSFPPKDLSLEPLKGVFESTEWRRAFSESVVVALWAAPLATALATAAALGMRRLRHRRTVQTLMVLPLIVPLIVTALAIYPVFSDMRLIGTTTGLIVAHALIALPFAFLTVWASISILDPQLERAAASLGAGWTRTLLRVTLPLIAPAIVASLVVSLAVSFDETVLSIYISNPSTRTVPVVLWGNLRENLSPQVAAAALLIVLINVFVMAVAAGLARWHVRRRVAVA